MAATYSTISRRPPGSPGRRKPSTFQPAGTTPPISRVRFRRNRRRKPPNPPPPPRRKRQSSTPPSQNPSRFAGVSVGARNSRAAAVASAGARGARARNRHSREPAQGRRKAHRSPGRGIEGGRIADFYGDRTEKRSRRPRFKGIVTMYEAMKPKDAAKVFDRLEIPGVVENTCQIPPRKM